MELCKEEACVLNDDIRVLELSLNFVSIVSNSFLQSKYLYIFLSINFSSFSFIFFRLLSISIIELAKSFKDIFLYIFCKKNAGSKVSICICIFLISSSV